MRTVRQLRDPDPNPWEVPWLVWAYTDPEHFYYVTLKPNGWEVGKADPQYPGSQRFLATGTDVFPVGYSHNVRVAHRGNSFRIWVDGMLLTSQTDAERPYSMGSVGVYAEDAVVKFDQLTVSGEILRQRAAEQIPDQQHPE